MLFDHFETNRLIICLDTASIDLMHDFFSDRSMTRLLEIECTFDDDYLIGHARRTGLAGEQTNAETLAQLLPAIRNDVNFESDRIRDNNFSHHHLLRERFEPDVNARAIGDFLGVGDEVALELAETPHLFVD
jgi:hypothetical protein